jgi:hypothetical protein
MNIGGQSIGSRIQDSGANHPFTATLCTKCSEHRLKPITDFQDAKDRFHRLFANM